MCSIGNANKSNLPYNKPYGLEERKEKNNNNNEENIKKKQEHHQSTVMICVDFNQFVRSVWRRFGMYMCFAYTIMLIVSYKSWFRLVRVVFHHIHMHMPLQPDTCTSSPTLYSIQTKQIYVFQIYLACQTLWHFWMYFVYNSLHLEAKKKRTRVKNDT